ncbi:MAG: SGNH/GDSL hydrolase family protein [Candidatus Abawacabacteria bacterium]|nr:SGNH/GDSL hydrolase family protein [Candidatus Abawacabacteria bacterium]
MRNKLVITLAAIVLVSGCTTSSQQTTSYSQPTNTSITTTPPIPLTKTSFTLPSDRLNIYTLGDSLTAGDRDDEELGGYPTRLEALIKPNRPNVKAVNIGHSGEDSSGVLEKQLPQTIAAHPDLVLLLIGSNDMWNNCWNENGALTETVAHYEQNIEQILTKLTAANIKVMLGLVDDQSKRPAAREICTATNGLTRMSQIADAFNSVLREQAARYNALLVDFSASDIFTNPTTLADDGNHPNSKGYEVMAQLWFESLKHYL